MVDQLVKIAKAHTYNKGYISLGGMQKLLRYFIWLAFFGVILWAWTLMFQMNMSIGLDAYGRNDFISFLELCLTPENGAKFYVVYSMWALMMAAMMGPAFVPTLSVYEDLVNNGTANRLGQTALIVGYFSVWLGFAAIFAALQVYLQKQALIDLSGKSLSNWLSIILLLVAGMYQFSSFKDACVEKCRSPLSFFLSSWKQGVWGNIRMGGELGLYCLGCCWAMMILGFVGGIMNLVWMGVATLIMTLEKLPDFGRYLTRPLGLMFITGACWLILLETQGG